MLDKLAQRFLQQGTVGSGKPLAERPGRGHNCGDAIAVLPLSASAFVAECKDGKGLRKMTTAEPVRAFISYSREDAGTAERLRVFLQGQGVTVWIDRALTIGDSLLEQLDRAILEADVLICLLSPAYYASRWTAVERHKLGQAAFTQPSRIVPVVVRKVPPQPPFETMACLDLTRDFDEGMRLLLDEIDRRFPGRRSGGRTTRSIPSVPGGYVRRPEHEEAVRRLLESGSDEKGVLIAGLGGIGKTTLAMSVAHDLGHVGGEFDDIRWIRATEPILAIVRELASAPATESDDQAMSRLRYSLRHRRVLIAIDGLDEVPPERANEWRGFLQLATERGSQAKVLVTSRSAYQGPGEPLHGLPLAQYQLDSLSQAETLSFLRRYLPEAEVSQLLASKAIQDLQGHPLALALLVRTVQARGISVVDDLMGIADHGVLGAVALLNALLARVPAADQAVLAALAYCPAPVSARTVSTIAGVRDIRTVEAALGRLVENGLAVESPEARFVVAHELIRIRLREMPIALLPPQQPGALYITIDPSLVDKDDFVELLQALNGLYVSLGGEELVIREEEVGHFASAEVLV